MFGKYQDLIECSVIRIDSHESIGLRKENGTKCQFHTTWAKPQPDASDIAEIKRTLRPRPPLRKQQFVVEHVINDRLRQVACKEYSDEH